jgi:transposase
MPHKEKVPLEQKVQIIEKYLEGRIGYTEASVICGIDEKTLKRWIRLYKSEGSEGLKQQGYNRIYSTEIKKTAARDYLGGKGSLESICLQYQIKDTRTLRGWIKVYNSHTGFKEYTGGSRMTKGRKTTKEERLAIAEECIANGLNYGETALACNVSYQQVYTWVRKINEHGANGIEDRRGQRRGAKEPLTDEEKLQAEIAQLKAQNYRLQMENDYLKKLDEVERRNR